MSERLRILDEKIRWIHAACRERTELHFHAVVSLSFRLLLVSCRQGVFQTIMTHI
jgi:hypothetical protein